MNVLLTILQVVQILAALGMIGLILMQHGKGADAGAAFGGGAGSASLFGASGGANFLSRTTAVLAAVFLACTLGLAYFGNLRTVTPSTGSVLEGAAVPAQPAQQIPGTSTAPAPASSVPGGDAGTGSGAGQIPSK
jgi:preprotein translocase subunit SecG